MGVLSVRLAKFAVQQAVRQKNTARIWDIIKAGGIVLSLLKNEKIILNFDCYPILAVIACIFTIYAIIP